MVIEWKRKNSLRFTLEEKLKFASLGRQKGGEIPGIDRWICRGILSELMGRMPHVGYEGIDG